MKQAGLGRRFVALALDWAMCSIVSGFVWVGSLGQGSFAPLSIFFIEVTVLTSLMQASAGQRILKLKVVDFQTGGVVKPLRILLRTFLICLVIPAIFTKDGRGLHDHFAHSVVVKG